MVTVKRKINNETDKFGGYADIEVKTPPAEIEIKTNTQNNLGDSFIEAQYKQAESIRDTRVDYRQQPQIQRRPRPEYKEVSDVEPMRPNEFMYKIHSEKKDETEESEETTTNKVQKVDNKTKWILGVYAAIILFLSALVIATGIFVSSAGTEVEELQNELAVKNAYMAEQLGAITMLGDEDALTGRAYNSGMERIEGVQGTIDLLPLGEVKTYEGSTNWFDSFCDWLNGVFGG